MAVQSTRTSFNRDPSFPAPRGAPSVPTHTVVREIDTQTSQPQDTCVQTDYLLRRENYCQTRLPLVTRSNEVYKYKDEEYGKIDARFTSCCKEATELHKLLIDSASFLNQAATLQKTLRGKSIKTAEWTNACVSECNQRYQRISAIFTEAKTRFARINIGQESQGGVLLKEIVDDHEMLLASLNFADDSICTLTSAMIEKLKDQFIPTPPPAPRTRFQRMFYDPACHCLDRSTKAITEAVVRPCLESHSTIIPASLSAGLGGVLYCGVGHSFITIPAGICANIGTVCLVTNPYLGTAATVGLFAASAIIGFIPVLKKIGRATAPAATKSAVPAAPAPTPATKSAVASLTPKK